MIADDFDLPEPNIPHILPNTKAHDTMCWCKKDNQNTSFGSVLQNATKRIVKVKEYRDSLKWKAIREYTHKVQRANISDLEATILAVNLLKDLNSIENADFEENYNPHHGDQR